MYPYIHPAATAIMDHCGESHAPYSHVTKRTTQNAQVGSRVMASSSLRMGGTKQSGWCTYIITAGGGERYLVGPIVATQAEATECTQNVLQEIGGTHCV